MKKEQISDMLEKLDPAYINEALEAEATGNAVLVPQKLWTHLASAAACLLLTAGFLLFLPMIRQPHAANTPNDSSTADTEAVANSSDTIDISKEPDIHAGIPLANLIRPYKNVDYSWTAIGYAWNWDQMTPEEQYTGLTFLDTEYVGQYSVIEETYLGESLGTGEASGVEYDDTNDTAVIHTHMAEVRRISSLSPDSYVAVKLGESYYVFVNKDIKMNDDPPQTLGALMEQYALPETLPLETFTYGTEGYFRVNDGISVWELLSDCMDAPVSKNETLRTDPAADAYVSFTATSDMLGVYKRTFLITEDGYIWTNIFDYAYQYEIGTEAAKDLIRTIRENAFAAEAEPYQHYLVGTLVEIDEDYAYIDDAVRCTDPDNGMIFRLPLGDIRIDRYFDRLGFVCGDLVAVCFYGQITADGQITEAESITNVGFFNKYP